MPIVRWLVALFSRPMRWSNVVPRRWLGRRRHRVAGRPIDRPVRDFEPTQMLGHAGPVDSWGRSLAAEVSEEPFDTFPAALQDEFGIAPEDPRSGATSAADRPPTASRV